MGFTIRRVNKLAELNGIKILGHGLAGSGKTVLSCTTGEPTLLISAESGLLSVANAPDYIHGVEVTSLLELEEVYQFVKSEENNPQYVWIALDSITEIAERILQSEKEKSPDPRKAYGNLADEIQKTLKKFRDLKNYDIFMSCKQQRIKEDGMPPYFAPMMPGNKSAQEIPYLFDEVFALRVEVDPETKEEYRILQTSRDVKYEAKDRSGALDMFEPPNLKKIKAKIKNHIAEIKKENEARQAKAKAQTKTVLEVVEEALLEKTEEKKNIAKTDLWWVHHESSSVGKVEEGEEIPESLLIEFISKEKFEDLIENENYSF